MTVLGTVPDDFKEESWEDMVLKSAMLGAKTVEYCAANPDKAFTRILVLPRGGLFIANIVCRMLEMGGHQILSMGVSSRDHDDPTQIGDFKLGQVPSREDVEGQHMLVIDEISDTDKTLKMVVEKCHELGAASVKTAVTHFKPGMNQTGIVPDFYVEATNGWVKYPWEVADEQGPKYLEFLQKNGY